ncbi:MAG TPA: hypothetical protein VFE02_17620 [Candidatus Acidoferrales bacterium]|jgi:hypothetical protein|nr:hypothetical protein [Candidatus Acidoferrales bacterium]
MANRKNPSSIPSKKPNLISHASHCTVCAHSQREEIEAEYTSWVSPTEITTDYGLGNRSALYRHANAFGLNVKRAVNIRAALCRIIEKADHVQMTGSSIIQAVELLARINSRGELVKPDEQIGMHELFDQMSPDELDQYAKSGQMPARLRSFTGTKIPENSGGNQNG